jgi:hypothetical protein
MKILIGAVVGGIAGFMVAYVLGQQGLRMPWDTVIEVGGAIVGAVIAALSPKKP